MSLAPHPFTLRQLQYAVAVADELSFRRAAERCHVAQPSLSAMLAQLEGVLGVVALRAQPARRARHSRRPRADRARPPTSLVQALDAGDLEVALVALEAELGDLEHEVVQALEVCSGGACARGRSAS